MDAQTERPTRRGPGRRPTGSRKLGRTEIVARGLALARTMPLQDISIVRIARELGVTPASIHYHLNGRDDLTSGIVNMFICDVADDWPALSGRWKADLEIVARMIYRHYLRYPGVATYFAIENRASVLFAAAETDHGDALFDFLNRYFGAVRAIGLPEQQSASCAIMLMQFIHLSAHRTASHQWVSEERRLRTLMSKLDTRDFPHIEALRDSYLEFGGDAAFESGLQLLLDAFAAERRAKGRAGKAR